MHFTTATLSLISVLPLLAPTPAASLGINCRGSGLCPLASWQNKSNVRIMQALRDALYASKKPDSTNYPQGAHLICVSSSLGISNTAGLSDPDGIASTSVTLSGKINTGGICVFPQGSNITLGLARGLSDKLLEHNCGTCGSVPVKFLEGSNDPGPGILTFNYVKNPTCTDDCIGADGNASAPNTNNTVARRDGMVESAKFRFQEQEE